MGAKLKKRTAGCYRAPGDSSPDHIHWCGQLATMERTGSQHNGQRRNSYLGELSKGEHSAAVVPNNEVAVVERKVE